MYATMSRRRGSDRDRTAYRDCFGANGRAHTGINISAKYPAGAVQPGYPITSIYADRYPLGAACPGILDKVDPPPER